MKNLVLLLFCVQAPLFLAAQPVKEYRSLLLSAERHIIENRLDSALSNYKKAFKTFDFPFIEDLQQAMIIAVLNNNDSDFNYFLGHALELGLNFEEYQEIARCSSSKSKILSESEFKAKRMDTRRAIDTVALTKYIELDMLDKQANLLAAKGHDEQSIVEYHKLIKRFIALTDSFGFPNQKLVGRPRLERYEETGTFLDHCNGISLKTTVKSKGSNRVLYCCSEEMKGSWLVDRFTPGKKFVFHVPSNNIHDSTFYNLLLTNYHNLNTNAICLIYYLELKSSEEYSSTEDYGFSYKSKIYQKHAKKVVGLLNLNKELRSIVDTNRKKIFVRTIQQERQLFFALYKARHNKSISKISKKNVNQIGPIFNIFFNYI